jgi:S-adenosylmethionine synthetase
MVRQSYLFTSESVSEGHPDKVCDRISDEIVDMYLAQMPEARVACEVLATTNRVVIAGEVRGSETITKDMVIEKARYAIKDIGYEQEGFHWQKANIECILHKQSDHIAIGVDENNGKEEGAGDQGIMFGYATHETEELMPPAIQYSHNILKHLAKQRHNKVLPQLEPDAKSQVTLRYENGKPIEITKIVLSTQHQEGLSAQDVAEIVTPEILKVLPPKLITKNTEWHINPTGIFVIGGPDGDSGLTGRKIIVDTYGGAAPHGGGAFSGKDPTKVDRSAAYACRYLAKNVVAAGLADKCTIQVSYAIGLANPMSFYVHLENGQVDPQTLEKVLLEILPMTPKSIRNHLQLNRPIYARTAAYGHFGRQAEKDGGFSWEKTDLVEQLQSFFQSSSLIRKAV